MENDCVKFRVDPDANDAQAPPAPTNPPAPAPTPTGSICLSVGAFTIIEILNTYFEAVLDTSKSSSSFSKLTSPLLTG
jgi:hypothetical protein